MPASLENGCVPHTPPLVLSPATSCMEGVSPTMPCGDSSHGMVLETSFNGVLSPTASELSSPLSTSSSLCWSESLSVISSSSQSVIHKQPSSVTSDYESMRTDVVSLADLASPIHETSDYDRTNSVNNSNNEVLQDNSVVTQKRSWSSSPRWMSSNRVQQMWFAILKGQLFCNGCCWCWPSRQEDSVPFW